MSADEYVQVGLCESCGVVVGESDFPNTPTCDDCGEELNEATAETRETVAEYANNNTWEKAA